MTTILGPDGRPAIEASGEAEETTPATLADFMALVEKHNPDALTSDKVRQARRMLERHPFLDKAYRAGLRQGRDLRERHEHGLGWWWDEMAPLTPRERAYVLAKVKDVIVPEARA